MHRVRHTSREQYLRVHLAIAVFAAIAALLLAAPIASAHEHREVGEYSLEVGFIEEPALVNQPNGLFLSVTMHGGEESDATAEAGEEDGEEGPPVEGLEETLDAEISYGSETMPLELRPIFDQPGVYTADVFPTAPGAYTFRIFGSIEGTEIDESFTSGPETFSEIEAVDDIAFPAVTSTDASSGSAAADAQDTADSARTLAIVGIIAGVLGLVIGGLGLWMALQARAGRTRRPDTVWE